MTTILIYWIIGSVYISNGSMISGQATFADEQACQTALSQLQDTWAHKAPNGVAYGIAGGTCNAAMTPVVVVPK